MTHGEREQTTRRRGDLASVTFEFPEALAPHAAAVSLLGPFNAWTPGVHRMTKTGTGRWAIRLFLPPGRILYCFDVDGAPWLDPEDDGRIPNGWGSEYSVRHLPSRRERAHKRARRGLPVIAGGAQVYPLEHWLETQQGASVLRVAGEVDVATVPALRAALENAVRQERPVIVDMSRIGYIDSTGLAELLAVHRHAANRGQHFVLATPSRLLAKLLKLTHLSDTIPTYPSVDAAVEACAKPFERRLPDSPSER
jgi:anti-sigma B factor antagonist